MIDQIATLAAHVATFGTFANFGIGAGELPAGVALAYIGPGAGLAAVGALIAVAGAGLTTIFGLVWYPVRELRRKLRENGDRSASDQTPAEGGSSSDSEPDSA